MKYIRTIGSELFNVFIYGAEGVNVSACWPFWIFSNFLMSACWPFCIFSNFLIRIFIAL